MDLRHVCYELALEVVLGWDLVAVPPHQMWWGQIRTGVLMGLGLVCGQRGV